MPVRRSFWMSNENARLTLWRGEQPEASGREAELSLLLREHDESKSSGRPRFVFLRGPGGVGKSHLFGQLRAALLKRGVGVFEGASGRDARKSFGLFQPLVTELGSWLEQSGVPEPRLHEILRAASPLRNPNGSAVMEDRRLSLYDAVSELFALAGRSTPAFLFPDVEVADKASLELLRYLVAVCATPASRAGGLFILSFRDDAKLPASLEEIVSKVSARSISLGGLDLDGIRGFLSRTDVAQRLLDATGGNPEALGELLERPLAAPVDFFLRRVERLSEVERNLLEALACSRDALTLQNVAGMLKQTGLSVDCASTLDALVRGHVVTVRVLEGEPVYRFAREAEKLAFASSLSPARMVSLKRALGLAMAEAGEVGTAAELLLEVGASEGATVAVEAADSLAARGAHENASELYSRAVLLLKGAEQAQVQQRHAAVLHAMGEYRAAARSYLQSARVRDPGVSAQRALLAARSLVKLGRFRLAELTLGRAAADAETQVEAQALIAEVRLLKGQPAQALALCRMALANAKTPALQISLRNAMGKALLVQGEAAKAGELFAENFAAAQAAGLTQQLALACLNQGVAAHKQGDRERAISWYQQTSPSNRPWFGKALANLGSLYADSGDFEPALEHLTRALQSFSRFGGAQEVGHAASNLGRLHHFLGDTERALELSEHALKLGVELGEPYLEGSALLNLGAVALDSRNWLEAIHSLEAARLKFESLGNDGFAALAAALKARAHLSAGDKAQASVELARRCVEKGCAQLPAAAVEVELIRGELALALGDLHGAGRAAARAKDTLLGSPDLEGPFRVYHLMGRLKLAASDVSGAQAEFARAGRLMDELVQRVPPVRRSAFLSVPRRAELLSVLEPELRLPRASFAPRAVEQTHGLVGRSAALQRIVKQVEPIGRSNAIVLVRGESGTGKELLAEALHLLSPRRAMPLVKVNCAAMVEDLLLSELFGHEKGAFTGAIRERKGRFELADGGTLFLDEIGDISPKCQVALLRVLQEREFERVGGTKTLKVDVRVICATNRDLEALIAQGRFRADLYYRLKGVTLELPSLRERPEDLAQLSAHFLAKVAQERGEPVKRLSEESLSLLAKYPWPGNVRELENVLSAAAIFSETTVIGPDSFSHVSELRALMENRAVTLPQPAPPSVVSSPIPVPVPVPVTEGVFDYYELARQRGISLKDLRHEVEMQCIRRALLEAKGNISEAARLLKMKRSRLSQIVNAEAQLKDVARGDEDGSEGDDSDE
jgi:transcriptional regulator with GAF, ATPase, and Fis domain/tetratricopeptide (TPR) repeat protein